MGSIIPPKPNQPGFFFIAHLKIIFFTIKKLWDLPSDRHVSELGGIKNLNLQWTFSSNTRIFRYEPWIWAAHVLVTHAGHTTHGPTHAGPHGHSTHTWLKGIFVFQVYPFSGVFAVSFRVPCKWSFNLAWIIIMSSCNMVFFRLPVRTCPLGWAVWMVEFHSFQTKYSDAKVWWWQIPMVENSNITLNQNIQVTNTYTPNAFWKLENSCEACLLTQPPCLPLPLK